MEDFLKLTAAPFVNGEGLVGELLEDFETLAAAFADVFIGGHDYSKVPTHHIKGAGGSGRAPFPPARIAGEVHCEPMILAVIVGAYLLGSVDFAVIVARLRGVNIYDAGSGNPGASNVFRTVGKKAGAAVMVLDLLKGTVAVLAGTAAGGSVVGAAAGLAAVVGHCYPVFYRFRGGKGAATLGGAVFAVSPIAGVVLLVAFATLVALTRIAAIGSLVVVAAAIPAVWLSGGRGMVLVWFGAAAALVLYRHRGNIVRLVTGSERKVVGE